MHAVAVKQIDDYNSICIRGTVFTTIFNVFQILVVVTHCLFPFNLFPCLHFNHPQKIPTLLGKMHVIISWYRANVEVYLAQHRYRCFSV